MYGYDSRCVICRRILGISHGKHDRPAKFVTDSVMPSAKGTQKIVEELRKARIFGGKIGVAKDKIHKRNA